MRASALSYRDCVLHIIFAGGKNTKPKDSQTERVGITFCLLWIWGDLEHTLNSRDSVLLQNHCHGSWWLNNSDSLQPSSFGLLTTGEMLRFFSWCHRQNLLSRATFMLLSSLIKKLLTIKSALWWWFLWCSVSGANACSKLLVNWISQSYSPDLPNANRVVVFIYFTGWNSDLWSCLLTECIRAQGF